VFHSPMILEAAFAPADRSLWVAEDWTPERPQFWKSGYFTTVEYHSLGKVSCDGLYLRNGNRNGSYYAGLEIEKVKAVGSDTRVWLKAYVTNPGNVHDKLVSLLFEVVNRGTVVASASTMIKAKTKWGHMDSYDSDDVKLLVPSSKLAGSRLRITMTTQDMATQD
jgi:hypothetical protein